MAHRRHSTRRWTELAKRRVRLGRERGEPCCRCGRPINYALPGTHRWGPTCEHLTPLAAGGDLIVPLEALGVSHRSCNCSHGARLAQSRVRPTPPPGTLTAWDF